MIQGKGALDIKVILEYMIDSLLSIFFNLNEFINLNSGVEYKLQKPSLEQEINTFNFSSKAKEDIGLK